jgi:hypothetical protein
VEADRKSESTTIFEIVKKYFLWKSLLCVSCRYVQYLRSLHPDFFRPDRDERLNQTIKQQHKQHKQHEQYTGGPPMGER